MRRFTLIELMIAVSLVSVLAALAVPVLAEAQFKAKRAELPVFSRGIADAVAAYCGDKVVSCVANVGPQPVDLPDLSRDHHAWVPSTDPVSLDTLGLVPDGELFGTYMAGEYGWFFSTPERDLYILGLSDVDDDDVIATYILNPTRGVADFHDAEEF